MTAAFSLALVGIAALALLDCSGKTNSALSIEVNPQNPIIIDQGSTFTLANGESVSPPYFAVNGLRVTWASTTASAQILALKFVASDGSGNSCAFSGADIVSLFTSVTYQGTAGDSGTKDLVDATGTIVTIPKVQNDDIITYTTGGLIYCSGLTLKNLANSSIYSSYNVPMDVALYGQTVDNSGEATGRIIGVANITLN